MAIAKNIFEESRPMFFITGLVGLQPPRICGKAFLGYLYVVLIVIAYGSIYGMTLKDTLTFYDEMSIYAKNAKMRVIQTLTNVFFVNVMIFSSVVGSSKVRQLYGEMNVVDEKMKLLNVHIDYVKSMKREIIHVCQVILVTILFNLIEYFPQIGPDTTRTFDLIWVVSTLPQFVNSLAIASFVVVISKIRTRFEAISELIPNMVMQETNVISTLESDMNNLFRLRLLNRIHEKLFEATSNLTAAYGLLLLTSFVVYFLTSCAHLRTVTLTFGATEHLIDFTVELLWTLFYLGKYLYIIDACHNVTLKGKLSGRLLYEKCTDADHQPLKSEADTMARRVEGRVFQLTACNFFDIDYPTLKKIVVVLAAYVFFVAQFSASPTQEK